MSKRKLKFIEEITPTLVKLESFWFPPGMKSPEGYDYGCGFCDMECGGNQRHDPDCLPDQAKKTLEEFRKIDEDHSYHKNWRGDDYSQEEILEIRNYWKTKVALETMYKHLDHLIPLDYKDPHNKSVICYCYRFDKKNNKNKHSQDCVMNALAQALANLYTPEN